MSWLQIAYHCILTTGFRKRDVMRLQGGKPFAFQRNSEARNYSAAMTHCHSIEQRKEPCAESVRHREPFGGADRTYNSSVTLYFRW